MNDYNDIEKLPDVEYLVEVFPNGHNQEPKIVRVGSDMLQRLVQKYDSQIMCCKTYINTQDEDNWHPAKDFGFYKQRVKTPAVAEARLRNTFRK